MFQGYAIKRRALGLSLFQRYPNYTDMQNEGIIEVLKQLKKTESDIKLRIQNDQLQLTSIQEAIVSLERTALATTINGVDYDKHWNAPTKFLYLLKRENRFLHFREAAELLVKIEGKGDVVETQNRISNGCQQLKKDKKIVKFQAGKSNQETFWGVPKWLDESGKIKPGHEFNPAYLINNEANEKALFEI